MILQALYQLYLRKPELSRRGYAPLGVSWIIALSLEGEIVQIRDFRKKAEKGSGMIAPDLIVPTIGKRTSGDKAMFLCDKSDYVLGRNGKREASDDERNKLLKRFQLFKDVHVKASTQIVTASYGAIVKFLSKWNPFGEGTAELLEAKSGRSLLELSVGNYCFMISGEPGFLHDLPEAITYWSMQLNNDESSTGICLVTGKEGSIARLHPAIKGIVDPGGQSEKGIVVINKDKTAFTSYGKEQSFNAPVTQDAAFGYSTALNYLLDSEGRRFRVGDASTVFWTDKPAPAETFLPFMMDSGKAPENAAVLGRLKEIMKKLGDGILSNDDLGDATTRYYILGLAPNSSRISVRFWHTSTLGDLATNLQKHFRDLAIVRQWDETNSKNPESKTPGIYALLKQTSRDADGIPPLLAGALMRSILLGTRYPDAFFQKVMSRLRVAEKDQNGNPTDRVSYLRAAIIKAFLNRNHHQNLTMSLDPTRTDPAYLLGRFFAVLEKTQEDALPEINSTIRDRFYSAASATPGAVFPRILRTYQHHLSKAAAEKGRGFKVNRERLVQDIVQETRDFPGHLTLQQQGQFAIGYYHQRQDFYSVKTDKVAASATSLEQMELA